MKKFHGFLSILFGSIVINFIPCLIISSIVVGVCKSRFDISLSWLAITAITLILPTLYSVYSASDSSAYSSTNQTIKKDIAALEAKKAALNAELATIPQQKQIIQEDMKRLSSEKEAFDRLRREKQQSCPWLANEFADYQHLEDMQLSRYLNQKARPAPTAAKQVAEIAKEKKELMLRLKLAEYQLNYYEALFPWLEEFKKLPPDVGAQYVSNADSEYDYVRAWLSPEEYQALPSAQKNQLALDRYVNRQNKSDWEIGIEYERYVGYKYEQKGYRVQYAGALQGLEDMGRDLIVENDDSIIVIQCKRWSKEKTIHEKHIFQLYGSTVLMSLHNEKSIKSLFVTTTKLSSLARQCAEYLHVELCENYPIGQYPLIKCNIAKDGSRIYHLPFDQQYDRVVIKPKLGEFYAWTVQEAEDAGFRRAFRWKGVVPE